MAGVGERAESDNQNSEKDNDPARGPATTTTVVVVGLLRARDIRRNTHSPSSDGAILPDAGLTPELSNDSQLMSILRQREVPGFLRRPEAARSGQRAKIEVFRPPRGVNSPRTTHHSGWTASTMSRNILLTAFS